jgi:hypothetical protein
MPGLTLANKAVISGGLLFWRSLCQGMTILTRMNAKIKEDPKKVRDYVQSIQLFL